MMPSSRTFEVVLRTLMALKNVLKNGKGTEFGNQREYEK